MCGVSMAVDGVMVITILNDKVDGTFPIGRHKGKCPPYFAMPRFSQQLKVKLN